MIFLKDTEGKYLLVNSRFERVFNSTCEEIIGHTDYDLFPRDVADVCRKSDDDALTGLKPAQSVERVTVGNETRVYLATKFPVFDESARPCGVCGIATDITELKRNEEIISSELALKSSIARVTEALLNPKLDRYDISKVVHGEALVLTGSKHGYVCAIDEETGENAPAYGLCGYWLNAREGFYTNNLSTHPVLGKCALAGRGPEFPGIERFLFVPALFGGRLIGQIALANPGKEAIRDYNDRDLETISRLASIYAIALERKMMEESLRVEIASRHAAENRLKLLLDATFEGISVSEGGRIVDANKRCAEMFGYEPGEVHGFPVLDSVAPEFREIVKKNILEGYEKPYEADFLKKDGSVIRVEVCGRSMEYEGRRIRMAALRDITERKALEERLAAMNKHLEERVKEETEKRMHKEKMLIQQSKMATMGEMIAAIAHQWKQPLNSLSLFIQDIRDAFDYGELDKAYLDTSVEKSMNEIYFMAKTVDEFNNFFKPSTETETFDLIEVVSEVFSILSAQLKTHSISYSVTCHTHNRTFRSFEEAIPCNASLITTYRNQLAHVVLNIINNAKDAIVMSRRPGLPGVTGEGKISVDCYKEGDTLKLSISDNGGGIPEEIMGKIFDPYFTTKSASSASSAPTNASMPEVEGTGIGLYMSKIIVEEKLGGSIHVRNIDEGGANGGAYGAEFTLEFTA